MEELKPCPFCGSSDIETETVADRNKPYLCYCTNCEADGPMARTMKDAIAAWNRRG